MKIKAWKPFKRDYERIDSRLRNPKPFRKALAHVVSVLRQGEELSGEYVVNPLIPRGPGWYDCYVYDDIILIYKIEGQYVKLSRLGKPKELER